MGSPVMVSSRRSPQLRRPRGLFGKFACLRTAWFCAARHTLAVRSLCRKYLQGRFQFGSLFCQQKKG
eukprot:12095125-Alexandrium_andersonii.AAC.1